MDGFGTELGLANLFLMAMGAAVAAWLGSKFKILLKVDLEKMVKRHNIMWTHYVKEKLDDTGDISDLMD
jgi:hypothetical protein